MSVGKEQIHDIIELVNSQSYVFLDHEGQPEGADQGLFDTPTTRKRIQNVINELKEFADYGCHDILNIKKEAVGRRFKTVILWEQDGQYFRGIAITIDWFDKKYMRAQDKSYYTIEPENIYWSMDKIRNFVGHP